MAFRTTGANGLRATFTTDYTFTSSTRMSVHGLLTIPDGAALGNRTIFCKRPSANGYTFNFRIGTLTGGNGTFGPNLEVNFNDNVNGVCHANLDASGNVAQTNLPVFTSGNYAVGCEVDFSNIIHDGSGTQLTYINIWVNGVKYTLVLDPNVALSTIYNPAATKPSFGGADAAGPASTFIQADFSHFCARIKEDATGLWPDSVMQALGGATYPNQYVKPSLYNPTNYWPCGETSSPCVDIIGGNNLVLNGAITGVPNDPHFQMIDPFNRGVSGGAGSPGRPAIRELRDFINFSPAEPFAK